MAGALDGIKVIDLTTVVMGPWAAQMLGDMGADVIKVETPTGDISRAMGPYRNKGMAAVFLTTNRNKRSIVLDLNHSAGLKALRRLIDKADVFMHNLRPKIMNKFGLGYDTFREKNKDLVYCASYGFRADGPLGDKPAYDDVIQTAAGVCDLMTLFGGQPRFVPTLFADKTAAYAVFSAILAAIVQRERGGGGQAVEVPMYETLVDFVMVEHLYGATFDPPIAPLGYERLMNTQRRPYATKDGFLTVLPYTDKNWRDFFELSGHKEMSKEPVFATHTARIQNSETVYKTLGEIISKRTTAEWLYDLNSANIPVMEVRTKEELLEDEQLKATGFWHEIEHPTEGNLRFTDPPFRYSKTPSAIRAMPPLLGEHSFDILSEVGYSAKEIEGLFAQKVSQMSV